MDPNGHLSVAVPNGSLGHHDTLVRRNEVFDVDEGIVAPLNFEHLQGFLNEITKVCQTSLAVLDTVAKVFILRPEDVHHWQQLAVVRNQGLWMLIDNGTLNRAPGSQPNSHFVAQQQAA